MRSIIERKDGSLVALTAGWFKIDRALSPGLLLSDLSRQFLLVESAL